MDRNSIEEMLKTLVYAKPQRCEICGSSLEYLGLGEYSCKRCHHIMEDDYGKVKRFMDDFGKASAMQISMATGVPKDIIARMIGEETVVHVNAEDAVVKSKKCESCGKLIERGRYCHDCLQNSLLGLRDAFGTTTKNEPEQPAGNGARMRFRRRKR